MMFYRTSPVLDIGNLGSKMDGNLTLSQSLVVIPFGQSFKGWFHHHPWLNRVRRATRAVTDGEAFSQSHVTRAPDG
jgi:hypothetical protein